jgi:hypothetical protein
VVVARRSELADLVAGCVLDPGWEITLEPTDRRSHKRVPTVVIKALVFDSFHPDRGRTYTATHFFPVPPLAEREESSWSRWLFDRYLDVLTHEAGEMFVIGGKRPFPPGHGYGRDPYVLKEIL